MNSIKERIFRNLNAKKELDGWYDEKVILAQNKEFRTIEEVIAIETKNTLSRKNEFQFISLEQHLEESGIFITQERIN